MNRHELGVHNILSISENLLGLSPTRLFSLSLSSDVLGDADHVSDLSFLLESNKLLGEIIHGAGDDTRLQSLGDSIDNSALIVSNKGLLVTFLVLTSCLKPLAGGSELLDEVESHLLTLEHHVLVGSTSDQSLKKDDGLSPLIPGVLGLIRYIIIDSLKVGGVERLLKKGTLGLLVFLSSLFLTGFLDGSVSIFGPLDDLVLSFLKMIDVLGLLSIQVFDEVKFKLIN